MCGHPCGCRSIPRGPVAIPNDGLLLSAEPRAEGGIILDMEFQKALYVGVLQWEGRPMVPDLLTHLAAHVGHPIRELGDTEVARDALLGLARRRIRRGEVPPPRLVAARSPASLRREHGSATCALCRGSVGAGDTCVEQHGLRFHDDCHSAWRKPRR